jgi:hypothetical protein
VNNWVDSCFRIPPVDSSNKLSTSVDKFRIDANRIHNLWITMGTSCEQQYLPACLQVLTLAVSAVGFLSLALWWFAAMNWMLRRSCAGSRFAGRPRTAGKLTTRASFGQAQRAGCWNLTGYGSQTSILAPPGLQPSRSRSLARCQLQLCFDRWATTLSPAVVVSVYPQLSTILDRGEGAADSM